MQLYNLLCKLGYPRVKVVTTNNSVRKTDVDRVYIWKHMCMFILVIRGKSQAPQDANTKRVRNVPERKWRLHCTKKMQSSTIKKKGAGEGEECWRICLQTLLCKQVQVPVSRQEHHRIRQSAPRLCTVARIWQMVSGTGRHKPGQASMGTSCFLDSMLKKKKTSSPSSSSLSRVT